MGFVTSSHLNNLSMLSYIFPSPEVSLIGEGWVVSRAGLNPSGHVPFEESLSSGISFSRLPHEP